MEKHPQEANLIEKELAHNIFYTTKSYRFCSDKVLLPNGKEGVREYVQHPGGVAVLAIDEQNRVAMVRQYRYAVGAVLTEIPAGKMDKVPGESTRAAAERELREETGLLAEEWLAMGSILPSPGIVSEVLHLFMARKLHNVSRELDEDEFIDVLWVPVEELKRQITENELRDVKTICALMKAELCGAL